MPTPLMIAITLTGAVILSSAWTIWRRRQVNMARLTVRAYESGDRDRHPVLHAGAFYRSSPLGRIVRSGSLGTYRF